MAGSRLEKFGTIFTRTIGLIKSGALREQDKPLWYNIYSAFPPREEPKMQRLLPTEEIKSIFYPEDNLRAKFYSTYGTPDIIKLSSTDKNYKSSCQIFVDKFMKTKRDSAHLEDEEIFKLVESELLKDGIPLKSGDRKTKPVTVQKHPQEPKSTVSVSNLFNE